jgi:hypothetical protein
MMSALGGIGGRTARRPRSCHDLSHVHQPARALDVTSDPIRPARGRTQYPELHSQRPDPGRAPIRPEGGSARVLLEFLDHSSLKERCRVNGWVCGVLAGCRAC